MKKTLLVLSLLASTSVFADPMTVTTPTAAESDSASAAIDWVAELPLLMPGKWVTFKGEGGGDIKHGAFTINRDGTFSTDKPVVLELRYWDESTGDVGDPVVITDEYSAGTVAIDKIQYQISDVTFTSTSGADVSGMSAQILEKDKEVNSGAVLDSSILGLTGDQTTSWSIQNRTGGELTEVIPGDVITAAAVVTVDLDFAAAGS
ncbi:hypothetical protein EDB65_102276 [Vibrio crassostreae]|uniref:hypothetical protein n=1 Tax=Vibrio crassostreae TaxID=246167 RepID=UPI001050DF8F|nr:hypothetical protein [Vibrio crassostreae]TCN88489.1 hypothetical protein EDB65_102276 [Vibrio crassostreae]